MALPAIIATGGSASGAVTSDQFNDLIKIQSKALTALVSIESALVKSASRLAEERLEGMSAAAAGGAGGAAAEGGGGGLGGLGKIGAGGLAAGLGIAAVLAGAGLAAGGISLLLNTLAEPGLGKAIRENVDELLSINEGNAKSLQSLDLLAVFTMLGTGLAIFGVGSTIAGLSSAVNKAFGVEGWAETIHDNVLTLLSIGEDAGGAGKLIVGAGSVAASLAMLGVGLAWFGAGSTITGLADAILNFVNPTWATSIKDNVLTLLSIAEEGASVLGGAAITFATLTLLGLGLAVFGVGSSAGALGVALTNFIDPAWAQNIKDNVTVLLSIADEGATMLGKAALTMAALSILGIGLAVFGVGSSAGALGVALTNFIDSTWAQNIKDNVMILLSIAKEGASVLGGAAIVFATFTLLGLGLAVFGVGSSAGALGNALTNFINPEWATEIKNNVLIMLSIAEEGIGQLGNAALVFATLTLLGAGLAIFGGGQIIAGLAEGVTNFSSPEWATNIKNNVLTLLSIADGSSKVELLAKTGSIFLAMSGLAAGIAVFSAGSAVAGIIDGMTNLANAQWATNIKNNVITLLSIADSDKDGKLGVLADTGTVFLALSGLAAGIAIFSAGSATAGLVDGMANLTNPEWATNIKNNVITLLSISKAGGEGTDLSTLTETGTVFLALSGLAAGLALFAVGTGVVAFVDKITNNKDYAQQIKDQVTNLLSIANNPNATPEKVKQVTDAMAAISESLGDFAGQTFFSSLKSAGAAVFNFFGGTESPTKELLKLADQADELEQVGDALVKIGDGLSAFANVQDLGDVNLQEFAEDLVKSLPAIETAIMGGTLKKGVVPFMKTTVEFKGLASGDIKFEEAAKNIQLLQTAFTSVAGNLPETIADDGATPEMIQSMTIQTAIIQSAIIQGPIAGAVGPGPGPGGGANTNVVTVMGSSNSSVSAQNTMVTSPGTSNPLTRTFRGRRAGG